MPLSQRDGALCLLFSLVGPGLLLLTAVAKLQPPGTGHWLLDWMREDEYYSALVPLTLVPVAVLAKYLSWFTNQLFRTN